MKSIKLTIFLILTIAGSALAQNTNIVTTKVFRLITAAGDTAAIKAGTSPWSAPVEGEAFWNATYNKIRYFDGSSWLSVGTGTGSGMPSLSPGHIFVGNVSSVATDVAVTGDISLSSAGVVAIGSNKVTNAMLAGSIDLTSKVINILPIPNGGTGSGTAAQNSIFAGPSSGGTGAPSFRTLVASDIPSLSSIYQPLNSALTTISGLTPSNDDVLQYKSGAWANRTIAQLKTDLGLPATHTLTGDITGSGTSSIATTLATVNSNTGTWGSATQVPQLITNGKGLITGVSHVTITPAVGSITGLGTGVGTWLATPSWTNFNSAITGTAPFWGLSGTSLLTGATTITSNLGNGLNYTGTWTASANNQIGINTLHTITSRATANDVVTGDYEKYVINASSTGINAFGKVIEFSPVTSGGVTALTASSTGLSGLTIGSYTNVSASTYSGSGTGLLMTITVTSATAATATVTTAGSGYKPGETITIVPSSFGGGSGTFTTKVVTINTQTLGTDAAVLALRHNGTSTTGAQDKVYINLLDESGVSYGKLRSFLASSSSSPGLALDDKIGNIFYTNTTGLNISKNTSLVGNLAITGTLTAAATTLGSVTVGQVTSTISTITNNLANFSHIATIRSDYTTAGTVASYTSGIGHQDGRPSTFGTITGGSGYTNGSYVNVAATGGSGSGLLLNVTVSGGAVTAVVGSGAASGYLVGDVVSVSAANIGGTGSGFSVPINTLFSGVITAGYIYNPSQTSTATANNYYGFYGKPTFNLSSQYTGNIAAFWWDPTITSNTGNSYSFVSTSGISSGGVGTSTPTALWDVGSSTTSIASLRIRSSSNAPTSPNSGDVWHESTNNDLKFRQGSTTRSFMFSNGTATTATAGSQTLPASPSGFMIINIPGVGEKKFPYYDN